MRPRFGDYDREESSGSSASTSSGTLIDRLPPLRGEAAARADAAAAADREAHDVPAPGERVPGHRPG